jgi:hypothetical protein
MRPPIAMEGTARICTSVHVFVMWSDQPIPKTSPHIDVEMRCWNRTGRPATVLDVDSASVDGHPLTTDDAHQPFREVTLEANGKSETTHFTLQPVDGHLAARPGDRLTIRFRLNWGVTRLVGPRISMRLIEDEPAA